jgi:Putative GTPase activating protein for Arf
MTNASTDGGSTSNRSSMETPLLPNEMMSGFAHADINPDNLQMDPKIFLELQNTIPGNRSCVDCNGKDPDWGSPALGILFCFQCSGKHR